MVVVTNTSPLNYLILIDAVEILPTLYQRVYVPTKVLEELSDSRSPAKVSAFAKAPPKWLIAWDPAFIDPLL